MRNKSYHHSPLITGFRHAQSARHEGFTWLPVLKLEANKRLPGIWRRCLHRRGGQRNCWDNTQACPNMKQHPHLIQNLDFDAQPPELLSSWPARGFVWCTFTSFVTNLQDVMALPVGVDPPKPAQVRFRLWLTQLMISILNPSKSKIFALPCLNTFQNGSRWPRDVIAWEVILGYFANLRSIKQTCDSCHAELAFDSTSRQASQAAPAVPTLPPRLQLLKQLLQA